MKQKKNNGISLIVLIITIVVIVILATAIIVNLAETNIIGNANEAVVKQDFKTFDSELDLYIADEYTTLKGKLDVTTIDATTKEDVAKIIPSIKGSKYEDYVTIVDGKIVVSDEMPEEEKEWINEVINSVNTTSDGEEIVFDNINGTKNTTINGGDFAYNNPVVPVGFMAINTPDANWNDANGWNNGLVIEDANGNEFVWVPVDGTNVKYTKNFTYPSYYSATAENTLDDPDALPSVNGINIDEINQINDYHGFYIGRYEAGVPANQTTIDGTYGDGSTSKSDADGIPVVKKGATVWTRISYKKAMPNAKSYINTANVKSGLLTGTAWDTVCAWIQSETDSDGNIIHSVTDSRSWGTHSNSISPANVTGYGSKQVTGFSESWKAKNIYDLAGNTWEWTGEIYSTYRISRGGSYSFSGSVGPASHRGNSDPSGTSDNRSFRLLLYVM